MIDYETYCRLRQLHQQGLHITQIAETLTLSRETVRKWRGRKHYQARRASPRPSSFSAPT